MNLQNELTTYLRAGYPGLAIITAEEARAEAEITAVCQSLRRNPMTWSTTSGLGGIDPAQAPTPCAEPAAALELMARLFASASPRQVVVMRDLQPHFEQNDPELSRRMRELLVVAKANGHAVILLGCRLEPPPELVHEFTRLDYSLPGADNLGIVLDALLAGLGKPAPEPQTREAALRAVLGMTTIEAENAFALSLIRTGGIDPACLAREKARTLKNGGIIEVVDTPLGLADIGGLDNLKQWLRARAGAFGNSAREYGLPAPKGLLVVGIPGTGKSLTAKATAGAFGLPLLRLDMGRVFGGYIGQSEANLRAVIQTAGAIAPCVLWIDEIEKGFSGGQGGGSADGGTSTRVFGSFLSWMQEKTEPVFVVATANDVSQLPPEFLRKGRFDEMFFVDLPGEDEREAIWKIVIARHRRKPADFDTGALARACGQFTGAEIEAVFVDALYRAFNAGREPTAADLAAVIRATVPLARSMDAKINALRQWAVGRTMPASRNQSRTETSGTRGGSSSSRPPSRRLDSGRN